MPGRLQDRTAIVTGASSGIGRAIALEFAKEGATVAIGDLQEEPRDDAYGSDAATTELIRERGQECLFRETDVTDEQEVSRLVTDTVEEVGGVDILVNNAGIFPRSARGKTIEEISERDWKWTFEVNLDGIYHCTKHAIEHIADSNTGRVINISSKMGLVGHPKTPAYAASKGGVAQLTRQLAIDYAASEVTVNAICPGITRTGAMRWRLEDAEEREYMESRTPLPYVGEPEDMGRAAVFFASDDSRFVTGQCLAVDGGWTAR